MILPANSGHVIKRLFCLKRCRADIAVGAVSADSIVVHFNVFEYRLSHLFSGAESFAVDGLHLERVEEALGASIIIAIALRTHAADQAILLGQTLVG